jgi:hypothetical protein
MFLNDMSIFTSMAEKIIEEQEGIIGPIALEQAQKVKGLKIDWDKKDISIEGNETEVVEKLIEQYEHLFGQASVEACKEAVRNLIPQVPQNQVPQLLR